MKLTRVSHYRMNTVRVIESWKRWCYARTLDGTLRADATHDRPDSYSSSDCYLQPYQVARIRRYLNELT